MPVSVIFLLAIAAFALAFFFYGGLLKRLFGLNAQSSTPAREINDGRDFVPTKPLYLLGQHFSAISAAGPIVGPIVAGILFGWLPAILWVVLGAIFIGAMHDFSTLIGSVRHKACSIAEILREHMSRRSFLLFLGFVWLALIYIIVAFTDITARAFVSNLDLADGSQVRGGGVATASLLYLLLGVVMGLCMQRARMPLWLATLIFVPLIAVVIWYGQKLPLDLPSLFGIEPILLWDYLILIYCAVASVIPVWALLQPRGYLGGFFLYGMLFASFLGILFGGMQIQYPAFLGWESAKGPLFPLLFITIACGACSGFHGIVCSGTTSKQLDRETDAHLVGYGGMLLEGVVAVISLITVMVLVAGSPQAKQDPNLIFAQGIGNFLGVLGIDSQFAVSFGLLAFATFVYDTLDVATRLGRYILQELIGKQGLRWAVFSTLATLILPAIFMSASLQDANGNAIPAWRVFWSIFGASNQLLAGLSLLGLTVWLLRTGKKKVAWLTGLPMCFMLVMTLWALFLMIQNWLIAGRFSDPVGWVAILLFALAILLIHEAFKSLKSFRSALFPPA